MARRKPEPVRVTLEDFTDLDLFEELKRRHARPPLPPQVNGNYAYALELLKKGRRAEARIELERALPDKIWATILEPTAIQSTSPEFVKRVRHLLTSIEDLCAPGCTVIAHDHDLQRIKVTRAADDVAVLLRLRT